MLIRIAAAALLLAGSTAALAQSRWRPTEGGIIVNPGTGPERALRVQVYGDGLFRVTSSPTDDLAVPASLMVTARLQPDGFELREALDMVIVSTPRASAEIDLSDGNVRFRNAAGEIVLAESGPPGFAPVTVEGSAFLAVRQQFNRGSDEGLYGLGQHQNRQMNYNGEDVELAQHNMDVAIPFVLSTRGYGLLWDNASVTRFGDPDPYPFAGGEGDGLAITGTDGTPGWTASYFIGDRQVATRAEPVIDYQYLDDRDKWPAALRTENGQGTVPNARVVWTGRVTPRESGLHRFRLYSSHYARVFVDGCLVLDRWRQNWNPWYHNFDLELAAGRTVDIRIEWEPNSGYLALLHNDPRSEPDRRSVAFSSEVGHALDYYFIAGDGMDEVISNYRALTGRAPMLPRWAYGFWQSRQRYNTQEELLGVLREYRRRQLPIDAIVQDWFYWPEDSWGCHCFDPARFPDPRAMVDEVHRLDARIMISVWPKFYPATAHYRALDEIDGILRRNVEAGARDWVGPGYANAFYDSHNGAARMLYWQQIRDTLGRLGFDAWWLDSDEPDFHSNLSVEERAHRMGPTSLGPGALQFNSYPLSHVEGVYDNLLEARRDARPVILTRSAFGGIQRTGAALWSGDVVARWDDLRDQISAGVNASMSATPYWTHDIGGFALEDRYTRADPAHVEEWRELNLRWFQFGAFSPLFRSHGEAPRREIFEIAPEGSAMYRSMEYYDRLRYRLLPYIYALGADVHHRDGVIMRGLVMDFPADRRAWAVDDQYLFGPAFLVAPVTAFRARSRDVYLPAGASWYDFHSNRLHPGGRTIDADAPYERMPLFVRAGSIVPVGPAIQHSGEGRGGPITLLVYTGADGSFSLYEDDGTSRQYLSGVFSRIPLRYDEASGTLTIGARAGSWPGMTERRTINVRWMRPDSPLELDAAPDATIDYSGAQQSVTLRR